jgi:hypothetical protein
VGQRRVHLPQLALRDGAQAVRERGRVDVRAEEQVVDSALSRADDALREADAAIAEWERKVAPPSAG